MATTTNDVAASERVDLQIGEKIFSTTKATIAESEVLSTLVSLRSPSEGPYFVDADPALFEHILRYLRTGIFPLLYDPDKGHDECLYLSLLSQARFYGIERLQTWIAEKVYLNAVNRRTWVNCITLCGETQIEHLEDLTHLKNERLHILSVQESRCKCFRCPKEVWKHHGRRQNCIRDGCIRRQDQLKTIYEAEMRVLKIEYVVTSVEISNERAMSRTTGDQLVPPPYDH